MNFFDWIRDGVKRSVLLGVSDAMEDIGQPSDGTDLHPTMATLLQANETTKSGRPKGKSAPRKRLGKSLKEMNDAPAKAA